MALSVLVVGHGAIAQWVARHFADDPTVSIDWVVSRPGRETAAAEAMGGDVRVTDNVATLPAPEECAVDYAIECAGHAGLVAHGPAILARGIALGIVSVGALAEDGLAGMLADAAGDSGVHMDILTGAIGAIDALTAAREGGLDRVVYTGRKPPAGWRGSAAEAELDLDALETPQVHFEGSAREAARRYPKNANVAATVALAGMGLDDTRVTLIADPGIASNRHEVEAEGAFGRFSFAIEGRALDGAPRSSALTAMSVARALRRRAATVRI